MSDEKTYNLEQPYNPDDRFKELAKVEPEFWHKKKLEEMNKTEWELLCDGCGKCCLNKIEIKGRIRFTNTHCRFLNCQSCLCQIYPHRFLKVPDCRDIDIYAIREQPRWLPKTCAYWLLDNGYELPTWHPLISKRSSSVHEAGMSLQNRPLISESGITDYEDYLVDWQDL